MIFEDIIEEAAMVTAARQYFHDRKGCLTTMSLNKKAKPWV